jgi:hypothetical protein
MDLYRRHGKRRNWNRIRAMSARLVNDLLPASHLSGVPDGFVVWFQQALQVIGIAGKNALLHSRSARLTDSASGLKSFLSWSQFCAAAGINKNGNRAKAHKRFIVIAVSFRCRELVRRGEDAKSERSPFGSMQIACYMHHRQNVRNGASRSGDAELLLHFFERDSFGFWIDEQDDKKLENHHCREKNEGIAAGRRRH